MTRIVIVGSGNVARHLFEAFRISDTIEVVQVVGRKTEALAPFDATETTMDFDSIAPADIYILAVNDDAIPSVSKLVNPLDKLVVHCSGSVPVSVLPPTVRRGCFYPLQTFTAGREVNFREIPVCVEAENKGDADLLLKLGSAISDHVIAITSTQRGALHLAAVFVNNFTNCLYAIGKDICEEHEVPFPLLGPLIMETAEKIRDIPPLAAQTGPARRGDRRTQQQQLRLLHKEEYRELYAIFSRVIAMAYAGKNLNDPEGSNRLAL